MFFLFCFFLNTKEAHISSDSVVPVLLTRARRSTSAGHQKTLQCTFKPPRLVYHQKNQNTLFRQKFFFSLISSWSFCAATVTASLWISQPTKDSKPQKLNAEAGCSCETTTPGALLCCFFLYYYSHFQLEADRLSVCLSVRVGSCIKLSYLSIDLSFSPSVHLWENHHRTGAQKCLKAHQDLTNITLWSQILFFFFKGIFGPEPLTSAHVFGPTRTVVQFIGRGGGGLTHAFCQKTSVSWG